MEDGSIVVVLAETIFMLMLLESFWTNNIKTQLLVDWKEIHLEGTCSCPRYELFWNFLSVKIFGNVFVTF